MKKQVIIGSVATVFLAGLATFIILYVRGAFDSYATKRDKAKARFTKALAEFEKDTSAPAKVLGPLLKEEPITYGDTIPDNIVLLKEKKYLDPLQDAFEALYDFEKYKSLLTRPLLILKIRTPNKKTLWSSLISTQCFL